MLAAAEPVAPFMHPDTVPAADWSAQWIGTAPAFNKIFWKDGQYRSPGYKGLTDDRANTLAVVAGLAKTDQLTRLEKHAGGINS